MAAFIIPISLDLSEESVGSHVLQVILFGTIPAIIPVIPSCLALELPLVSPFLCSNDSEVDSESEPAEQRPERPSSPSGSSSHDTLASSSEFLVALVVAPPGIRRRPAILIRPEEAIPFGRSYRTHPNGSQFTSDSSSYDSSSDSSSDSFSGSHLDSLSDTSSIHSSECNASGQTHSGPSTRVASSKLVYPLFMTPRYSEAIRCWRSAPLSTPYPPMTSELSLDSSSKRSLDLSLLSARPSRKRCKSPTTSVPSSTPILRSIALTLADLLPPRKRFRDLYLPEDSRGEHMEIGTGDAEAVADLGIGDGVGVDTNDGIGIGVEIAASDIREDEELMASEKRAGLADRIRRLGRENLRVRALLCIKRDRRFQELTLLCTRMVLEEEDQIKRYVGGHTDNIQGNAMSTEPTRLQDEIRLANSLMDQKLKGYAIRSAENKIKFESNQIDNRVQQPQFNRQ
nr:hypothetical protein [Tanacetum cinerariifolium]